MTETPPLRADQVGSLLRTKRLADARAARSRNELSASTLKAVENDEIRLLVKKQEDVGLASVTDGEFRRAWWHYDFFDAMDGIAIEPSEHGVQFKGMQTKSVKPAVRGKIGFPQSHPFIEHFTFLAANTKRSPKMTIPSPSMLYYRGARDMFHGVYKNIDDYYNDMAQAFEDCTAAFYAAGCRHLQIDDVSFAYLCDPKQRQMLIERGDNPDELKTRNIQLINRAFAKRPKDMVLTAHLCRGNFRSTFVASGGYEPVAQALFGELDLDGYFLEYDNERSGGFAPLRHLPKGPKRIVLGLVTTKTGGLESKDEIKRRIDEAARFAPLEQLCLSPQCGFASTEEGNAIAEEDQWRKLELVVETAREVWS